MGNCMFLRKGETHTAPLSGILASDIAVGSTVKLMENGTAVDYLVVNQGIPSGSSLYDSSCDGMWLLRKDCYENRAWHSSNVNDYANSTIHAYLNGDFFNLFGTIEQSAIKQVKIPYQNGTGSYGSIASGSSGLSTKIFLLGGYEVGFTTSNNTYLPVDGAKLSYFTSATQRIAKLNGTATHWWLRSPTKANTVSPWYSSMYGELYASNCITSMGIRPALVLPSTAIFDKNTMVLKGVS